MAKIDMGRSRFKIQRRLGVELPGLGKAGALERKPYGPGQHGMQRKKLSDYTVRLVEKQKVMFNYGLRESQLRNYVKKSKKVKTQSWVDTMIVTLESRLDNVVFRLNQPLRFQLLARWFRISTLKLTVRQLTFLDT